MIGFLLGRPVRKRASSDGLWTGIGGHTQRVKTRGGVEVDENVALTYSACWAATRILTETIAGLPLFMYLRQPNDDFRKLASDHSLFDLVKAHPNESMGSMAFRECLLASQINWGNGFAEIERETMRPDSPVKALWPIHASRVGPVRSTDTDARGLPIDPREFPYRVRNNDGASVVLRASEMLHVPGCITQDGIWGKGVIAYARESIGFGLATERHGATMFGAGLLPRGFLSMSGMKDPEVRRQFRQEWKDVHGHPDASDIAVLPPDAKFYHLIMNHEDSQFLETRKHNITEISRWYRLPPHLLGDLERATFSNVESQGLDFIIYSLMPWIQRWEEQLALKLLTPAERADYYFEHQLAGLLRGDLASRYAAYAIGLEKGFLTINQVCRLENMPGIGPAGDQHFIQLNMTTAENMLAGIIPGQPGGAMKPTGEIDDPESDPEADAEGDPGTELLDLPDYRQESNYDCGAAVTHSVCEFFSVGPATHQEYIDGLGTTPKDGTDPIAIIDFVLDLGLKVTAGGDLTVDDLRTFFLAGQPVICPVQMYGAPTAEAEAGRSGHYVVCVGVGLGQVFIQDPSSTGGRRLMDAEDFLADWHDLGPDGEEYSQFGIAVGDELPGGDDGEDPEDPAAAEGTAPAKPGTQPAAAPAGPGASPASGAQAQAAKAVLTDTLSRMFAKEAHAAARAAKGNGFDSWAETFYPKHQMLLAAALAPALEALRACTGRELQAGTLAQRLVKESLAALRTAYDSDTPAQFKARLEAWPKKWAGEVAGSLLRESLTGLVPARKRIETRYWRGKQTKLVTRKVEEIDG